MQIELNSRHFTLGEEQIEVITETLEKLEKFSPRPVESLKMTITHEAGLFAADAVLYLKNNEFRAKGEGREPEYVANEIEESMRKQLIKFKGKVAGRHKGEAGGLGKAMVEDGAVFLTDEPAAEGFVLQDLDVAAAKQVFKNDNIPFLVFRNTDNSRVGVIYRCDNGEIGHMESSND